MQSQTSFYTNRVSIIRDDPSIPTTTLSEELLIVRGPIENCVNACREILKIVKIETTKKNPGFEAPLRMVVHNEYIGRVIGKEGKMIFSIKSESGTELAVSSLKDKNNTGMDVERIITIKGGLENALKALELIQTKVSS